MPFAVGQQGLEAKAMPSGQTEEQLRLVVHTAGSEDSIPCGEQVRPFAGYVAVTHQWSHRQGQARLVRHRTDRGLPAL